MKVTLTNNQRFPRGHDNIMLAPGESGEFELAQADLDTIEMAGLLAVSKAGKPPVKAAKPPVAEAGAFTLLSAPAEASIEVLVLRDELIELGVDFDPSWDEARLNAERDKALAA
jgi:hypothetical protein